MRVHGLRCSKAPASYSARCQPQHIVAGVRFHWSREERRFQRERFSRAWFILATSARARRYAQRTEHNGGFGFQTKVKGRSLNQRRWTCWYSCRENMQVLSATASLVLLFFLFSFWKACYLLLVIYIKIENSCFELLIFKNITVSPCIFNQINAGLVSKRDCIQKQTNPKLLNRRQKKG